MKKLKYEKEMGRSIRIALFSLVATCILYAMLLYAEHSVISRQECSVVYVASKAIEKGQLFNEQALHEYFEKREFVSENLPEGCITELSEIEGCVALRGYGSREIVTQSGFLPEECMYDKLEEPVEVSVNTAALTQAVGGVLREGDYINIWSVSNRALNGENTVVAECICEEAYVLRVFASGGDQIGHEGAENTPASMINIVIPKAQEKSFNEAMAQGTIRIGRCMYDISK